MTDPDFEKVAVLDLAKHLDKRIETVLQDYMDRCCTVGISYEDATAKAITVLSHYFIVAALGIEASESEVVAACRWHYERMRTNERADQRAAAASAGSNERRSVS
jgi:hypothetical protein